ncbi:PREDICTED: uncharacterized protein LOC105144506 isoform X2 [Acromyrmex echinatior]|uniref:uncharacterized protein LOC105144506 isoform X2 n=1 Tax=Acromyrmex echinatior TaxID=103372 RepID=UPI000580D468|nr:PREDICTED: uncharacterized protein LOC105144506 isoform X2 [Acromyrmex echinatior]
MCLYCALGEFLVAQCNEIYYAAYSNEWYSVNSKITQDLLLLLIRGAKPIHLTAGKIFPMTMMTFCRYGFLQTNDFVAPIKSVDPKDMGTIFFDNRYPN